MRKFLLFILLHAYITSIYAQPVDLNIRWKVIDTPLVFPSNFTDWIRRNVGTTFTPYNNFTNRPFGDIIQTDQTKNYIDFNRDGKRISLLN